MKDKENRLHSFVTRMPKRGFLSVIRMLLLLPIIGFLIFCIGIPCMLLEISLSWVFPKVRSDRIILGWALKNIAPLCFMIFGIKLEFRNLNNFSSNGVLVAKHASYADSILTIIPSVSPVLKSSLLSKPHVKFFNYYAGSVAVKRNGGTSELKRMLGSMMKLIFSGKSVLVFPEGTRVRIGESKRYHFGFISLYPSVKIFPVATNSAAVFGRSLFDGKLTGPLVFEFLPQVPNGLSTDQLKVYLENEINSASDRLIEEFLLYHRV